MANSNSSSQPAIIIIPEDEEDLDFLHQVEEAEARALSFSFSSPSSKRRRITITDSSQFNLKRDNKTDDFVGEIEEGAYTAALKGSKSLTWKKHNQLLQTNVTVTKPYESFTDSGGGGGACFRCGKEGHWARDCGQMTSSVAASAVAVAAVEEKACACGLGNCLVLTANTERNRGRRFYRCPFRQENGGCGFFEWCDISSGNYNSTEVQGEKAWKNGPQQPYYKHSTNQSFTAHSNSWNDYEKGTKSPNFSYRGIQKSDTTPDVKSYATRTGSSCFKCGEEGHWARDCPSSTLSDGSRGKSSSDNVRGNSSSSACFKCGQSGHWARDCSQPQFTTSCNW